jgi:hypothetical protein
MCKHTLVLAAIAVAVATALAGAKAETPGPGEPVTISPEELHQQVDARSLPLTYIEEPY